jgi:hypothetical protein
MALFLVTSGWMGNGHEGVIVEALTDVGAIQAAQVALANAAFEALPPNLTEDSVKRFTMMLQTYKSADRFEVKEITLPYIDEFG